MKISVKNTAGEKVKDLTLVDSVWNIETNDLVLKKMIKLQLDSLRQGTHKTKTRSEVSGGGRKPWKQKGTGRARQGSIRAPQWRGGGTVFGPTPRSYKMDMPRKARRLAMKSVLSQKVADNDLIILDQLTLEAPKTKELKAILDNANVSGKVLVVSDDKNVQLSGKNLPKVKVVPVNGLNVVDAVDYQKLVLTQDAIKRIEEVLA